MEKEEQEELRKAAERASEEARKSAEAKQAEQRQRPQPDYNGQHQCAFGGRGRIPTRE